MLIVELIIVIAVIAVDLIVKHVVDLNMVLHQTIPVIENIFNITYVHNTGAAFSILENQMLFFYIITPIAVLGFSYYLYRVRHESKFQNISLALIIGGTLGNFYDRVAFQYVRDMFEFKFIDFAVFNVADIALTVGTALFIIYLLISLVKESKSKKEKVQEKKE